MSAAALLAAGLAAALQESPPHSHVSAVELRFGGKRALHRWADLDGDGRKELLVVETSPRPVAADLPAPLAPFVPLAFSRAEERTLEIFWNGAAGFDPEARSTYRIPRDARAFAVADVLPSPGKELVLLDGRGAVAAPTAPGDGLVHGRRAFRRIAAAPSFYDFPSEDSLPEWGLVLGAGPAGDALVLPRPDGFQVFRPAPDGSGLAPAEMLAFTPQAEAESSANRLFGVTKTLPRPFLRDLDGDGAVDFGMADLTGSNQMIVYAGRLGGRFSTTPAARRAPSLRREIKGDDLTYETAEAIDLNRDGVCDLVISRTSGNIGLWDTLSTSQLVYYGRKGPAGFDTTPDQVVSSVGVSIVPRAIDFDGDGQLDLLVSSYRTDLLSNLKNAVFNSARVSYFLFLMRDGKYPRNPTVERSVDIDFKLLEKGGVVPRASFDGDFDGDGVKDLLATEEAFRVRAYRGVKRAGGFFEKGGFEFESAPMMEIAFHVPADVEVLDVDGDGRSEVVYAEARLVRIARYAP